MATKLSISRFVTNFFAGPARCLSEAELRIVGLLLERSCIERPHTFDGLPEMVFATPEELATTIGMGYSATSQGLHKLRALGVVKQHTRSGGSTYNVDLEKLGALQPRGVRVVAKTVAQQLRLDYPGFGLLPLAETVGKRRIDILDSTIEDLKKVRKKWESALDTDRRVRTARLVQLDRMIDAVASAGHGATARTALRPQGDDGLARTVGA